MTPLRIYRLWLGPAAMPEEYVGYGYSWARLNPGWQVVDFFGVDVDAQALLVPPPPNYTREVFEPSFLTKNNQDVWYELANGAVAPVPMDPQVAIATQRADVAGYEIVAKLGGLYVNCDMQPLNPLANLCVPMGQAMVAKESPAHLSNAAMAAPLNHPFFNLLVRDLSKRFFDHRNHPMNQATGPYYLTEQYKDWGLLTDRPGVHAAAQNFFNFAHYSNVPKGMNALAFIKDAKDWGAIAIHHWGHRGQQRPD